MKPSFTCRVTVSDIEGMGGESITVEATGSEAWHAIASSVLGCGRVFGNDDPAQVMADAMHWVAHERNKDPHEDPRETKAWEAVADSIVALQGTIEDVTNEILTRLNKQARKK